MRDPQIVETELVAISTVADDAIKLERLAAWSIAHPDEIVFALRFYAGHSPHLGEWVQRHLDRREAADTGESS